MRISLDRQSNTPLYQQIENFLRQGILSGNMQPGTRLPATRQLAHDLGVNRITVENAYAGLEAAGLIASQVGSGTYVLEPIPQPPGTEAASAIAWPLWQQELPAAKAGRRATTAGIPPAAGRHPDLIDFESGMGDAHLFPVEEFRKGLQAVMRRDGLAALDYGEVYGYAPLRATIARVLASQGLLASAENILITSGSQQAIALVAQALTKAGEAILVESPTYSGALDLFRNMGLKIVSIPCDENGMQVENLERLLQQYHPWLIYTIPNFHNPTGACLSGARRRQLIELAERYNTPVLEDDFVGDLRYEGRAQPALKALDPGGRVIYVSTFSKMLMPGLRVGFMAAEGPVYEQLVERKRVTDLATSNLFQRALEAYVTVGRYQAHLRRSCQLYRRRRDAMLKAIAHCLPEEIRIHPPQGGLFIWLRLPKPLSAENLLPQALEAGVSFAPGNRFFPQNNDNGCNFLRLNFAMQPPEKIEEGIRRLGEAIQHAMPPER